MKRREFVGLVGSAAAWPLGAGAQQDGRVRRVGVLTGSPESDPDGQARLREFRLGLAAHGWIEGRNLELDIRAGGADVALFRVQARELIARSPEVVLATNTPATLAMKQATRTVPIVFVTLTDPVATGVVTNLARPESNVTGFMLYEYSLAGKWLSLLKDISPALKHVAVLFNPDTAPNAALYVRTAQTAGEQLALAVTAAPAREAREFEPAVAAVANSGGGGLLLLPDAFNTVNSATIIALAAKYRVPAIYFTRFFTVMGGLFSYGMDQKLQYRDGATYVDRILRGAKPSDLPVQFATKFELVINLKTAKALGLDVRPDLLTLADEVIE